MPRTLRALAPLLLAAALIASSCSSGGAQESSPSSTTVAADQSNADANGDTSGGATTDGATVDANTASVAEMTAAFEAAGVPNAARWAREVEEYRPYSDDGWAHLRQELDKYNIDDATFDQIVSVLSL